MWDAERVHFRETGQFSGESEAAYKTRYMEFLERGRTIGHVVDDEDQADDWIAGLLPVWEPLQLERANKKLAGEGLPTSTKAERAAKNAVVNIPRTLAAAFKQVQGWALSHTATVDLTITAATVSKLQREFGKFKKDNQPPNPRPPKGSKEKKTGAPVPPALPAPPGKADKESRSPTKPCLICDDQAHWTKDCPWKEVAQKACGDAKAAFSVPRAPSTGGAAGNGSAATAGAGAGATGGGGRRHVNYSTISGADVWADRSGVHVIENGFINLDRVNATALSDPVPLSFGSGTIDLSSPFLALLDRCASDTTLNHPQLVRGI